MILKKVNDEKIISALIATPTIREASVVCGYSESTIYARLRDSEFKARYDVERRGLLERNAAALQSHLGKAIATMAEIVDDKNTAPQIRLNAADANVRNSLKLNEQTEIIRRVDELEAIVNALEERKR